MKHDTRFPAGPAIVSALTALVVFAVTLGGAFVYDDFDVFSNDARLRLPSMWWKYLTESYNGGVDNLYRPFVSLSYAIQWFIHGDKIQWPYHAVNWILHAGVAALVAELTRRLTSLASSAACGVADQATRITASATPQAAIPREQTATALNALYPDPPGQGGSQSLATAYVAGLLFAVHPIHVEAVANVVGRAELLCAIGFIGALVLFARRPLTAPRVLAIFACLVVSILSKEQGMLLPPMLLAMAWLTHRPPALVEPIHPEHTPGDMLSYATRKPRPRISAPAMLLAILVCWSVAGYVVFRESILKFSWDRAFLDWTINPLIRSTGADRWLMPFTILGHYVALLIAPIQLSADYGAKVIGWTVRFNDPFFYLGIAVFVACACASFYAWREKYPSALFCVIGLTLTYGLISNFALLIGTNFGERLMYLPSVFFIMLAAIAATGLLRRSALIAVISIVILLFSIRTISYAQRWNDRQSFYEYSIARQPNSIRLRMLLIAELESQGKLEQADAVAADARELLPEYDEIWLQSADLAAARGDLARAEAYADRAMKIRPSNKAAGRLQQLNDQRAATQSATTQPIRPK